MNCLDIILLGLIQGLTEFFPVSSSGHLFIGKTLLAITENDILFDIVLHLGTLLSIFKEYNVGGVVLGLPLSLDGNENERTEKVRKFAKELSKNIKVTFYDERYSSDVIYKELRKNSISRNKIKKKINQLAASYILQGFLDNARFS